jgi:hypothetical protein
MPVALILLPNLSGIILLRSRLFYAQERAFICEIMIHIVEGENTATLRHDNTMNSEGFAGDIEENMNL